MKDKRLIMVTFVPWQSQHTTVIKYFRELANGNSIICVYRSPLSAYRAILYHIRGKRPATFIRKDGNATILQVYGLLAFRRFRFIHAFDTLITNTLLHIMIKLFSVNRRVILWLMHPDLYPLIRHAGGQTILLDTLDLLTIAPDSYGRFLLGYKSSALIYDADGTHMKKMTVIPWGSGISSRMRNTGNALSQLP